MKPPGKLSGIAAAITTTAAAVLLALPLLAAPAASASTAAPAPAAHTSAAAAPAPPGNGAAPATHPVADACATPKPGYSACLAQRRTDIKAHKGLFTATANGKAPKSAAAAAKASADDTAPSGYGPAELQDAYSLPSATAGSGRTVAIVDAFDDPNAEADLAVYRAQYGLPACTSASGCFRKVAQDGSTNYPPQDPTGGWQSEESLDIDMVSAVCPKCHILLVEASDNGNTNLGVAVDEAVALGAKYVSNSYGGCEAPDETSIGDVYFDHPGVVVTASSGDDGFDMGGLCGAPFTSTAYPAASPYVTAVGGTTLTPDSSAARGWDETAWAGAGSGCSLQEPKPSWQTDPGCANRMATDVSADADPDTGVAVYDSYGLSGWVVFGGTSVASPIIASVYALAGTPAAGSNPASYPYLHPSALNDVTSGNNNFGESCTPAYECNAGPGYDGPTGLGTPDGTTAFTIGAHGTVAGTVTNARTHRPVAGAQVTIGSYEVLTSSSGKFSLPVPAGSQTLSVSDFAYATRSVRVQVGNGQTVTENLALQPVRTVTISGTVADGSGAGWALYAKVTASGTPASTYTNPATGAYSLTVPASASYTLTADPLSVGYQEATASVQAGTANLTQDLSVQPDTQTCAAPGYTGPVVSTALNENFDDYPGDGGTTPPPGWTIVDNEGSGNVWSFNSPEGIGNLTPGGSGFYASISIRPGQPPADSSLISPVFSLAGDQNPVLQFSNDYFTGFVGTINQTGAIDISTDSGQTWTNVWQHASDSVRTDIETVPLTQFAGDTGVQARFRLTGSVGLWWELDNIQVTNQSCVVQPGGLVVGTVKDARSGAGVDSAVVTSVSDPSVTATTGPTADPAVSHGFWSVFLPDTGSQQFTVADASYPAATVTTTVTSGAANAVNIRLASGQLQVASSVSATEVMGSAATRNLTFTNTGQAPVTVTLHPQTGGFTEAGQPAAAAPPVNLIKGSYSPDSVGILTRAGKSAAAVLGAAPGKAPAAQPADAPWTNLAAYPGGYDNAVATDPATGLVYSVGGVICCDANFNLEVTAGGYVYNPATLAWTALPPMQSAREDPSAAFIDGKLYVTGGFDNAGNPVPQTEAYDPATQTWTTKASSMPHVADGAGSTVLGGNLYVIGGCDYYACDGTWVQVYHPTTDTWTTAASYPEPVSWEGCGTISGKIYCAGGDDGVTNLDTSDAYVYDPAANSWSPVAPYPIDNWGMAYGVGNGQLLLSGGVTENDEAVTNQGWAYDPVSNAWTALPNANTAAYRGGSSCGFYHVGGLQVFSETNVFQQLPGYSCATVSVPWLSASTTQFTLSPGQHTTVAVTLNAGDPSVSQPGTYTAALDVTDDTPYNAARAIGVTLTARPPATWGKVTGTVKGTGCNGTTSPLSGALVEIFGSTNSYTLFTSATGKYQMWVDKAQNPLTILAAPDNWNDGIATVTVRAGKTVTANFDLAPYSC